MSKMIRISEISDKVLTNLRKNTRKPKQMLLKEAIELLFENYYFKQLNLDYKKLRKNAEAWKNELEERSAWDVTLKDGLKDE